MHIIPVNNTIQNSVTYVLYSEDVDYCILVDCGEYETLQPVLEQIDKKVRAVLLTHGHFDHILGLKQLINIQSSIIVYASEEAFEELGNPRKNLSRYAECSFTLEDYKAVSVTDKMLLPFEGLAEVEVIATPGHSPSCMTYRIGKNLFTGDAYIPGVKVFTKFPRGNKQQAVQAIELISAMEQEGYTIHCGHHSFDNLLNR